MQSRIGKAIRWFSVAVWAALFALQVGAATPTHFFPMTSGAIDGVWTTDLDAAKALAAANGRPMLIYVGNTAECGYCRLAEEKVLLLDAWKSYALSRGLALVYLDKTDPRYMTYVAGTTGAFPIFSVYLVPTPTTMTLKGRFTYRPDTVVNGIAVVQNPANFIAVIESYLGAPVAPLPVMTADYADLRGDASAATATELLAQIKPQVTPKHSLNDADTEDWFRMAAVAGGTYRLQNLGVRIAGGAAPTVAVYKDNPAGAPEAQYPLSDTNIHTFVAAAAGAYYIRVSRAPAAGVDINYWLQYQRYVAPPVVNGPDDAFVALGQTATFTVNPEGEGPFSYQWYRGTLKISGKTNNVYSVALTLSLKGTTYKCLVTNLGGSTYSRVATLSEAGSAKMQVNLTPPAAVTAGAQWSPNGGTTWYASGSVQTLATGNYTITFKPVAGWSAPADITDVTLSPTYATTPLVLAGAYTAASVSLAPSTLNLSSNQQDTVINVTATAGLAWTAVPSAGWITIEGGNSGTGSGAFTVRVANNSGLTARSGSVAVGSATLAITQNPYQPDGQLTVTLLPALAASSGGQWSPDSGANWYASGATVSLPPATYTVSYQPVAGWTKPANASAVVTVAHAVTPLALTGTYTPVVTLSPTSIQTNSQPTDVAVTLTVPAGFDWTAVPSAAWITIEGADSGTGPGAFTVRLATNDTAAVRNGTVAVAGQTLTIAQNPAGGTGPLTIVTQPLSQKIMYGKTANLSILATGAGPITYQWRKITSAIAGATSPDYTTPALMATTRYSCLVRNPVSSKTSAYATITVVRMWRTIAGNTVSIELVPTSNTARWTVTETIPAGLTPADYAASGGVWNASLSRIVWTGTGRKTLTYTVSGPAGAYALSGTVKWSTFTAAVKTEGNTALVLPGSLSQSGDGLIFILKSSPGLP